MRRNPIICLIIVGLLMVSLAGQAAAAFQMACEGTASCCCRNMAAMPDMENHTPPMDVGCCGASDPQPCDLAGPGAIPVGPYLPTESVAEPTISAALASTIPSAHALADGIRSNDKGMRPAPPAGPPVYLLVQSFLC